MLRAKRHLQHQDGLLAHQEAKDQDLRPITLQGLRGDARHRSENEIHGLRDDHQSPQRAL